MKNLTFILFFTLFFSCNQPEPEVVENQLEIPEIDYDKKLADLNIQLPTLAKPLANYVDVVQAGKMLFLAGKGPKDADGNYVKGKIGEDLTQEEGYAAARMAGLAQIAVLKNHLGDLNRVKRIVKVVGMVNCTDDYGNQPEVVNGFSDLMVEVFGERGKHARAAVGMNSLPRNICVEIDAVVEIY